MSVQVLFNGIEAVMVTALMILKSEPCICRLRESEEENSWCSTLRSVAVVFRVTPTRFLRFA